MCDVVKSLFRVRQDGFLRLGGLFLMLFWEDLGGRAWCDKSEVFRSSAKEIWDFIAVGLERIWKRRGQHRKTRMRD